MPTIKELEPKVLASAEAICLIPGVKSVYSWGNYADCFSKKDTPIREVELLVLSSFNSGDLLAIDRGPMGPFNIAKDELEDLGFNPQAVSFTKHLLKKCEFRTEFWTLSSDKKLLHWGPVSDTIEEWKELRIQAEEKAEEKTGFCRKTLKKADQQKAKEWIQSYEDSLQSFINKGPLGWYESTYSEGNDLYASSKCLAKS